MSGLGRVVRRAGAALAVAALLGACGVSSNDHARVVDPSDVPEQLLPPATTTPESGEDAPNVPVTAPVASDPVQVFFVRDQDLVPVTRRLPLPIAAADAVAALVAGPDPEARTEGLRSALGDGTPSVVSVDKGGLAVVELTDGVVETAGREQRLAIGQLVFTLTGLPGVDRVRFVLDGDPARVPRGDGTSSDPGEPVDRDDYAELLAET